MISSLHLPNQPTHYDTEIIPICVLYVMYTFTLQLEIIIYIRMYTKKY